MLDIDIKYGGEYALEQLQEGIAQADRGQTLTPEELRASIAKRFPPRE